jgi:hypothetical protein
MKTATFAAVLVVLFSGALFAADPAPAKTKFTLVKVVDRDEKETYQVLESAALTALQDEIKIEERLFDKAMALAEKAWKADEFTKSKPFPRSAINRRSCAVVNTYTTRESADKALTAAEEKVSRAEAAKKESDKKREDTKQKMGSNKTFTPKKKDPKEDAEKKMLEEQARTMFAAKVEEIKRGKTDAKDAPPPDAAGQAKDKPDPKAPAAGAAKH